MPLRSLPNFIVYSLYLASSTVHRRPRNAKLVMASVLTVLMIRRRSFRQKVASVSIACSWTRSVRCHAFHRPKAMLTSRCAWVFSCDMIFTPHRWPTFLFALPMAAEQPTALNNVKVVFFRENASVAILAADSKRSF